MSLLKTLSDVAGGVSSVGSIASGVKGVAGLLGLGGNSQENQLKYQKQLIDYQNKINQQNAQTDYDRQRQLTADSPLLGKIGMKQAGINTSQGSTSVAAASVGNISPPSSPSALIPQSSVDSQYSNMATLSNLGLNTLVSKANIRKANAEAEGAEIDNLTRDIKNLKEIGVSESEIQKNFAETAYQNLKNKYADNTLSAEADSANSKAIIDSADASVRGAMNKASYDLKVQEIFNAVQTGELTRRQAIVELKKLSLMDSQIDLNNSQVGLNSSIKAGQDIENFVNDTTKGDKIATIQSGRVKAWYDAQPKDVQQLIMTSDAVRSAVKTLQNGRDLSWREYKALGAAMGYENAGKLVGSLIDALNIKSKGPKPKVSIVKHVSSKK